MKSVFSFLWQCSMVLILVCMTIAVYKDNLTEVVFYGFTLIYACIRWMEEKDND